MHFRHPVRFTHMNNQCPGDVTHMNESCHVTHMDVSSHTYECVMMSTIWMSQVRVMSRSESCHTYEWVMSCHMHEWVMSCHIFILMCDTSIGRQRRGCRRSSRHAFRLVEIDALRLVKIDSGKVIREIGPGLSCLNRLGRVVGDLQRAVCK